MGAAFADREVGDRRVQFRGGAAIGATIEDPTALLEALDQAGRSEQLEVTRNARLALARDGRELADRELGLAQNQKQPEARGIACGAQHRDEPVHG